MASEEARDWRTGLSLLERQRYMYEGKYACDVTFKVGKVNPEKISAHKFVLVCGSPVFEAMLTEGREGDIVLEDVEPEVFNVVLKFLYCEQIELKADTIIDVLQAARKYEVSQLVVKCTDYLMGTIDVHNVCLYLNKSVQYDENELSAGCVEFISNNTKQVLDSKELLCISHQSLKKILESDIDNWVSPRKVYTACLRWTDAQCATENKPLSDENRRAVLGSCLYLIRFPDMSNKEFIEVTRKSNLLTFEERGRIFDYIAHREHGYEYEGALVFKVEKHKPSQEWKVKRFMGSNHEYWGPPGLSAVDFQCSRNVWITGVGLYVGDHDVENQVFDYDGKSTITDYQYTPAEYCEEITVADCDVENTAVDYDVENNVVIKLMDDEGEVLADTGNVVMDRKDKSLILPIKFTEFIHLRGNHTYRITAEHNCNQYRYGNGGQETVEVGGVTFTFKQTPGNKTTVYEGQIPEIMFAT